MKQLFTLILLAIFTLPVFSNPNPKYSRVKVFASTPEHYKTLMELGVALESKERKPGHYFIGEFSENEVNLIQESGIESEILIDDLTAFYVKRNEGIDIQLLNREMKTAKRDFNGIVTPANFSLGTFGGYHNYAELLEELDEMRTLFPNLISVKAPVGLTSTIEGRPVYWVRISNNPDVNQEKTKVLYTALTHAREPAGLQQMLFQMWYILENYATNAEIQALVNNLEIYFIPCVNPDGYLYNQSTNPNGGGMWRKNRRNNGNGTMGVDLNRNFGYMWGIDNQGSSPNGSSETYRGTQGFSEPESQIVKQFCESREISLALNNHTYSDVLIYPFGYSNILSPDSTVFVEYAKRMTAMNNYQYGTCYQTLGYTANGGSDDWFYGEQTTKNKILAFTPEAGKASDGFWPAANKIEEICSGHTEMNLYIMRFALPYAEIIDMSDKTISSSEFDFSFMLKSLGRVNNAAFTVSVEPISTNILSVSQPVSVTGMGLLDVQLGSIIINMKSNVMQGDEVVFAVHVNNGLFTKTDTITKFYGIYQMAINDNCESMIKWNSTTWNVTTTHFVSPTKSITDSPSGQYASNANTTITYSQPIDLTDAVYAYIEFQARWDIESGYDYVQLQVSENNTQWTALGGIYTKPGNQYQAQGQPVWDGTRSWVQEEILLGEYTGKTIYLRFRLVSDGSVTGDGFYFDDFKLYAMVAQTAPTMTLPARFEFDQNSTLNVNFTDYIAASSLEGMSLAWEGNSNVGIVNNQWVLSFSGVDTQWYGEETVTFTLNYGSGQIQNEVVVEVRQINGLDNAANQQAYVYCLPGSGKLLVYTGGNYMGQTIELYSVMGQKLNTESIQSDIVIFDASALTSGVYIIRISNGITLKALVY
jgi:hypothetical protein